MLMHGPDSTERVVRPLMDFFYEPSGISWNQLYMEHLKLSDNTGNDNVTAQDENAQHVAT